MPTDFEKLDKEVLDDWREHPATKAFYAHILNDRAHGVIDLIDSIKAVGSPGYERLQHIGGRIAAVDEILRTMSRSK